MKATLIAAVLALSAGAALAQDEVEGVYRAPLLVGHRVRRRVRG